MKDRKKDKLWGPFIKFYTRFPIPWHFYIGTVVLGILAGETALWVASVTIRVNKGELYNSVIVSYVLLSILNAFVGGARNVCESYASGKVSLRARDLVWKKIVSLPMKEVEQEGPANLISCVTNDVTQASSALSMLFSAVSALYTYIRSWAIMIQYNLSMSMVLILAIPLVVFLFFVVGRLQFITMRKRYESINTMTAFFSEHISCAKHVKAQCMEEEEIAAGWRAIDSRYKADIIYTLLSQAQVMLNSIYMNISTVLIAVRGSSLIRSGQLESTGINDFSTYSMNVQRYQAELLTYYQTAKGTQGSMRHVNQVLERPEEDLERGERLERLGDIELKDVSFSFDGAYQVLKNVSFTIPYGKRTAIIGGNGSGKSTVMKLLQGFYWPDSGSISINGQDISQVKLKDLRGRFAYVLQNTPLLSGTIRENLVYGAREEIEESAVIAAAKLARAHDFIMELPQGYDTQVGAAGTRLSGGQRQRVAIARALLVEPAYLILDEATASLDHESGGEILENILHGDTIPTVVYISHNMEEVRMAAYVIVMSNGSVEAAGTPEEVARASRTYRDYAAKQRVEVPA